MNPPGGQRGSDDGLGDWANRPAYGSQSGSSEPSRGSSGRQDSSDEDLTQVMKSPPRRESEPPAGYVVRPQRAQDPRQPPPTEYLPRQQPAPRRDYPQQFPQQQYPQQPPQRQAPPGQPPYEPPPPSGRRRKPRWGRRIGLAFLAVLLLIVGFAVYLDFSLTRVDALTDYEGRPAETPGTDWLLVGSDSREGLTEEEQDELATGFANGKRTDTIILVHVPDSDAAPTMVSLPRDSLVSIEGQGQQKLNAAYAFGGPQLLVRTVEGLTDIRIDRYAEIGLVGFADMVDAVGGVEVCLDQAIKDPKAGIDLPAGCQELNGANALGYVRTRATPRADLDRVVRQRQLLSILVSKATSVGTIANPLKAVPFALAATGSFAVDDSAHLWHLASLGFALGDSGLVTTTVPIAGTPTLDGVGSVVQWDEVKAEALFAALRADKAVPKELVTN